jgi:hypothetical protein
VGYRLYGQILPLAAAAVSAVWKAKQTIKNQFSLMIVSIGFSSCSPRVERATDSARGHGAGLTALYGRGVRGALRGERVGLV